MNCQKRKKYENKMSFWTTNNVLFLLVMIVCIAIWVSSYYVNGVVLDDIAVALISAILLAALTGFGHNCVKFHCEKAKVNVICTSIIELSAFLVNDLNTYLWKMDKFIFESFTEDDDIKKIQNLDFSNFKTLDDLFDLIATKLSKLTKINYLITHDNFKYSIDRLASSTQKAWNNGDYNKLYRNLHGIVTIMGTIKPPRREKSYTEVFNRKISKTIQDLKDNFYSDRSEYIITCLENDLAEKADSYNKK